MPIGLENSLTATAAREIDHANKRASGLGESMTTGTNKFAEVVDKFLGSSLKDNEIMLGAIARNTAYGINMLTITDEYLSTISTTLQNGISSVIKAGTVSSEKVNVLQKNLKDLQSQIKLLVRTADFDGKKLLGGKADMAVQVGLSAADNINVKINDLSDDKMMRTTVTNALNEALAKGAANAYYTANPNDLPLDIANNVNLVSKALNNAVTPMSNAELSAVLHNAIVENPAIAQSLKSMAPLTINAISNLANIAYVESDVALASAVENASGGGPVADNKIAARAAAYAAAGVAVGTRTGKPVTDAVLAAIDAGYAAAMDNKAAVKALATAELQAAGTAGIAAGAARTQANGVPVVAADIGNVAVTLAAANTAITNAGGAGAHLTAAAANTASAALIDAAANDGFANITVTGMERALDPGICRNELKNILADFDGSSAAKSLDITTAQGRAVTQDVLAGAQNSIRAMQASVSNQKSNVAAAADALRSTTNVTQKAADSYLKTDYVMTAQQYSETIKRMVASITTLQAANKIPEAAQRLIDALAR